MKEFQDDTIDLVVTSPPYWGLRDYASDPQTWGGDSKCNHEWGAHQPPIHKGQVQQSKDRKGVRPSSSEGGNSSTGQFCSFCGAWCGQLGLEPHPQMFIDHLIEISREIKRVIKPQGSYWLNLGDTYFGGKGKSGASTPNETASRVDTLQKPYMEVGTDRPQNLTKQDGRWIQPKQMLGIPWRVAIALQDDGWILRNCVIWYKRNHMPESVKDRLTKSYEFFFFFVKQPKYYFNLDEIREPYSDITLQRVQYAYNSKKHKEGIHAISENGARKWAEKMRGLTSKYAMREDSETLGSPRARAGKREISEGHQMGKNPGDMWDIPTQPFQGAHFAVFPITLIEPIIKSSSPPNGIVLDPFAGSGTALRVARKLGRQFIGIEINPEYAEMCERRVKGNDYTSPPKGVPKLDDVLSWG